MIIEEKPVINNPGTWILNLYFEKKVVFSFMCRGISFKISLIEKQLVRSQLIASFFEWPQIYHCASDEIY